jgi:hypothetical protein
MFLSKPNPERICKFSFPLVGHKKPSPMLSVGLTIVTHDTDGLKIVPETSVRFAIGETPGDAEMSAYDVPISFARDLAERIIEMCDAADEGKTQ